MTAPSQQETEAKFLVHRLQPVAQRLNDLGARLIVPRHHEYNLRFDRPDGALTAAHQVLRLRRGDDVRLTWKGPSSESEGVRTRTELEVVVQDFAITRQILAALGFREVWIYEKYRALYRWQEALITLDETPIGRFVEIEAASPDEVRRLAARLGLDGAAALPFSYHELFQRLRAQVTPPPVHLTFQEWEGLSPDPLASGLSYAD